MYQDLVQVSSVFYLRPVIKKTVTIRYQNAQEIVGMGIIKICDKH